MPPAVGTSSLGVYGPNGAPQTFWGGASFQGAITLGTSTQAQNLNTNGASGQSRQYIFETGGVVRSVLIGATNEAETGSNAGSNVNFNVYNDAGSFIATAIKIVRAGGHVTLGANLKVIGEVGFYNTSPLAQQTVTGSRGSNAALASLLTVLAATGLIVDGTS